MGYDMSMIGGSTDAEQEALDAARKLVDAAVEERNKHERGTPEYNAVIKEVERLFDEMYSLPSEYYRLNIFGMGRCRDIMLEREMIYLSHCPDFPDLPHPQREDFDSEEKYEAACSEWDEKYEELCDPVRELHPEGGDGIPSHKLGSNDGWHVTEEECAAAVAAARASELPAPTVIENGLEVAVSWWPEWVDFLDRASKRGGFRVY